MSETLASQDFKNLQEMPGALEMGELRKITTLQDISLAEGDGTLQQSSGENERKWKSNSLKKFFRLPNKKKSEGDSVEPEKADLEIEEALGRKGLKDSFSKASLKSSLSGYWSSVFKPKKSGKSTKSNQETDSRNCEASSSLNTDYCVSQATTEQLRDNLCDSKDSNVLEEIQSLNISDECPQK